MEDLKELKQFLSGELEESFRRGKINNMPRVPMVIIYTDEEAKKAKEEIDPVLLHIWGERKNSILQFAMTEGHFSDIESGEILEDEVIQESIDDMYAMDQSFRDMSRFCAVFIQSTGDCTTVDEFRERFESIHAFEELGPEGLMTVAIVLLDESTRRKKAAVEIKAYLRELLENESNPYASTIILSNRLSNGSLLAGNRIRENYIMVGWIILLLNGVGSNYMPQWDMFFPMGREYYLTAAFAEVNRPNDKICDKVLHTILMWIDKQIGASEKGQSRNLDNEDLYQRLDISGSRAGFLEDYFQREILPTIPSVDIFRFMPRKTPDAQDITSRDFRTADQETMGACSEMLKSISAFDHNRKDDFSRYMQAYLKNRFSAAEREKAFTVSNIQDLLRQLQPAELTGKERLDLYIREKIHSDFVQWALPICEDILKKEQKSSANHTQVFEDIIEEFRQSYFPENSDLERYYENLTNEELDRSSGDLGQRLLNEISSKGESGEFLLEAVKKTAEEIFSARSVFRMPLEQEMITRIGQNPNDIHNQIYNALFKDLDGKIRLKTTISQRSLKQFTIVNQRDENGNETELYRSIKQNVSNDANMVYFDSGNSNTIKIFKFFACQKGDL